MLSCSSNWPTSRSITPRAFVNTLQISSLAVLIAVTVGTALLGIIGALLALPVVAAIPAIARAWSEDDPVAPEHAAPWPAGAEPDDGRAGRA